MNPFDIVIVVVIAFCLIRGAFRGIIKEASSIIGVIAGVCAGYIYYKQLAVLLEKFGQIFPNSAYINIISFLVLFCIVFAAVSALGILIKYLLKIVFLAWIDKLCGAGFGFIKGVMIVSVLLMILTTFLDPGVSIIKNSVLCPYVSTASEAMSRFASKEMRNKFSSKIEVAKKSWGERAAKAIKKNVNKKTIENIAKDVVKP